MASSKEYLDYILEQLSDLDEITYRAMMGEYILYYHKKNHWRNLQRPFSFKTC